MANTRDFFQQVSQRLLSNWTALRMAVEHGMGSHDRAVELPSYITEVFYTNDNPASDEIAEVLDDYMENEFHTELQDNSTIEVAQHLWRFYRYCKEGNEALALTEMDKLPPLQTWILSRDEIRRQGGQPPRVVNDDDDDSESSSDEDGDDDNKMAVTPAADDDWTQVTSRRRK